MSITLGQLAAAAEKTAAIARKLERRRRWLALYDVDRLAGGITALNVAKIAGQVVIDPQAEVRAAVYASGMGQIRRLGEQTRQIIASVAKRPVVYDLKAAMQKVITPIVLDVMEAGKQAAWRGLQTQISLAVQMLADSAASPINGLLHHINVNMGLALAGSIMPSIKGFLDTRPVLVPDWVGLAFDSVGEVITIIAEYWKEGTFTGDVLRVAYEGEYYTKDEAEAALDRLIDRVFTLGAVTHDGSGQPWALWARPYVKPLIRQAIADSAEEDYPSVAEKRADLLRRVCELWAGKSHEILTVLHDFQVLRPGQVSTWPPVASAPALASGETPAPADGREKGVRRVRKATQERAALFLQILKESPHLNQKQVANAAAARYWQAHGGVRPCWNEDTVDNDFGAMGWCWKGEKEKAENP